VFYDFIWDSVVSERISETVASLLPAGSDVLDFGCGSGLVARRLSSRDHGVVAVDSSSSMLRRAFARGAAREYLLSASVPTDRRFESAIVVNVLHLVSEPSSVLDDLLSATEGVVIAVWPEDDVSIGDLLRWERAGGASRGSVIRAAVLRVLVGAPGLVLGIRRTSERVLRDAVDAAAARHSRRIHVSGIPGTGCVLTALIDPRWGGKERAHVVRTGSSPHGVAST
jgi:SAM-dependent methyltransferase